MVRHYILISKLKIIRTNNNMVKLITSFVSNRQQAIPFSNCYYEVTQLNIGVSQGLILCTLPFTIYINDLPVHPNITCDLFTDDCTIYNSH